MDDLMHDDLGPDPSARPGSSLDPADPPALASLLEPQSPLALRVHRTSTPVVGRPVELAAIQRELSTAASGRLSGVTVEGEPGIGKTRLLLAAREMAVAQGCALIAVAADEELRGPFLLARSMVGSADARAAAAGTPAEEALSRSLDALSGRDDPGLESMPRDQKLLRSFDLGAVALSALAAQRTLALLIDDLQWADEDSLRLLRYIVRSAAASPVFMMLAVRPVELAFVNEGVNLIADLERLGMIRRFKVSRFTQVETAEFLRQVLGGKIDAAGVAAMHAQAEGVPFIIEEMAHAYRDAGMIQQIDGTWRLTRNAERLVPSAVKTLISRRAARLPEETKALLAHAGVLGRRFSLKDLREVTLRIDEAGGEGAADVDALAQTLAPAVAAGLLVQNREDSAADYSFGHDQVRDFATASLSATRRRAIHAVILELLMAGDPRPESLLLLAHHAKAAGEAPVCVRFSIEAIRNALDSNAPEEVLRVADLAMSVASTPQDRVTLLQAKDEALSMLRRPQERLEGLSELAALAEALGDAHLGLGVQLRRAAAMRLSQEEDSAAELARAVRERAAAGADRPAELAACLELGQDLLHTALGEAYTPPSLDLDLDAAEEAYGHAASLAEELGDDAALAGANRELGVIALGRLRAWFVEQVKTGAHLDILRRVGSGEVLEEVLRELPAHALAQEAGRRLERALELYERVGDRRGAMAAVIAMAYLSWAPDIHLGSGSARHIEEIRRLSSRMQAMTKESDRAMAEGQMLYGTHVFARAKVIPDLAIARGEEAFRHARLTGDRALEFLAAGGTAMALLDLGDVEGAHRWVDRAAAVAVDAPTPLRARRLETWRGRAHGAAGEADRMRQHLERAARMATEQGRPAARCEALARLALESSRLGAERSDEELLDLAEASAKEATALVEMLPGHPPWGAQADAALARVALARGDREGAAGAARSALAALQSAMHEDMHLDVALPVVRVLVETGAPEQEFARMYLRLMLPMIAQRTFDAEIRARWFRGPVGREMSELAGPVEALTAGGDGESEATIDQPDAELLKLLIGGLTNREIAERLDVTEAAVPRLLQELFARIGAASRAEATAFAFRERVL